MPATPVPVPVIAGLGSVSGGYEAILCDIWGVVHNGRKAFPDASEALRGFRRQGGVVVLITNAPRPAPPIRAQVLQFGLAPDAFDDLVTSGDVAIALIAERIALNVHHIGPERDLSLFEAAAQSAGIAPKLVDLDAADYVLCTGLFDDETETPDAYEATLARIAERGIPFVCANPDLIVHRGETLVYCAGALAERLKALGGDVVYCGKPHAPIYRLTLARAERALGRPLDPRRVLAIGDGMRTDILGAAGQGLDALFVSGGIHFAEVHGHEADEASGLSALFARERVSPIAAIRALRP